MADTTYSIAIPVEASAAVEAASILEELDAEFNAAVAAAEAASNAIIAASSSFESISSAADSSASAVSAESEALAGVEEAAQDAAKAADKAEEKLDDLGNTSEDAADKGGKAKGKFGELSSALEGLGIPVGAVGQGFDSMGAKLGPLASALGPVGAGVVGVGAAAAIAVVAVVALTAAFVAGAAAVLKWGIGLAESNREAELSAQAWDAANPKLAGLQDAFWEVEGATGVGGDALRKFAQDLDAAGVAAADMPTALNAVATAEAALPGEGAKVIESLKKQKGAIGDVADEVQSKFGGIVEGKMMTLSAQMKQLEGNIGETFGGLDTTGFEKGFSKVVGLFDSTTESGKTLKFLFESLFQPLLDSGTGVFPVIEAFVIALEIRALQLYIAFKPIAKALGELTGIDMGGLPSALDMASTAADVFIVALAAMAAIALSVGAAIAVVTFPIWGTIAVIGLLVYAVYEAGSAIISGIGSAVDWLSSVDLAQTGLDIVTGLANGITSGASAVLDAMTSTVTGAIDAAKGLLGIASPSKVFAELGGYTGQGFVEGVEDSSGDTQAAMESMVAPPEPSAPTSSGGGGTYTINITINAGGGDAGSIEAAVRKAIVSIMEGYSIQLGTVEVPA